MSTEITEVARVSNTAPVQPVIPARDDRQRAFGFSESAKAAPDTGVSDQSRLQQAVDRLNQHFSNVRTDLKFSIEKDLGVIVVAIVDAKDGTVLRQMPSEEALRISRVLSNTSSHLIEAVA